MGSWDAQELMGWVSEELGAQHSRMLVTCSAPTLWLDLLCLWIPSILSPDWLWASCQLGQVRTSKRDGSINLSSQKCSVPSETQVKCALSCCRQSLVTKYLFVTVTLLYLRLRLQACNIQSFANYSLCWQFVSYAYPQNVCSCIGNLVHTNISDYRIYYCCLGFCF